METLDIVPEISQLTQRTPQPGSRHDMWDSGQLVSIKGIACVLPDVEAHSSPMKKVKPVEPVSFYHCILPPHLITLLKPDSDEDMVLAPALLEKQIGKLHCLTSYLSDKHFVYRLSYVSAFPWFRWQHCEIQKFIGACARVVRTKRKVEIPKQTARRPINSVIFFLLQSSGKVETNLVTKFTNKIEVSDVIQGTEGGVSAWYEWFWMTTVMPQSSMYPTA